MKRIKILMLITVLAPGVVAQNYILEKYVIASGGGHMASPGYQIDATIGQAIIGQASSVSYIMDGGFWPSAAAAEAPSEFAYLAGDANMHNETVDPGNPLTGPWRVGGDVTFLVNYFNVSSGNQPCLMFNPTAPDYNQIEEGYFFASGDATGDCQVLGGDVSRLVQYFAGNPLGVIRWCGWDQGDPQNFFPPQWLSNRGSGGPQPVPPLEDLPEGWPNCQTPPVTAKIVGKTGVN